MSIETTLTVPVMTSKLSVLEAIDFKVAAEIYELREHLPVSIANSSDVMTVTTLMKRAGALYKQVNKRREFYKEPLSALVKRIDEISNQIREPMKEIEAYCKELLGRYKMDQHMKEQEKHEQALIDAAEDGRHTPDLTQAAPAQVDIYVPKVHTRTYQRVRIVDESVIPRKYLVPDVKAIEADALNGVVIPGVELYSEEIIVNR